MEQPPVGPNPEGIDVEIEQLLGELDGYAEVYNQGGHELQEQWYWIEMEARVAKDRQAAKTHLAEFIGKLKGLKKS